MATPYWLVLLAGGLGAATAELCGDGQYFPLPNTQSMDTNSIIVNLVPQDDLFFQLVHTGQIYANISYEEWVRFPANNSIFDSSGGSITVNNPYLAYPPQSRPVCASSMTLGWPDASAWGACGFQPQKSNILAIVPAQANSISATDLCVWTTVQLSPNQTVSNTSLRIALASFVTPVNTTYQTPIAFQYLCTNLDTKVASYTATPIEGSQRAIPMADCVNTQQGCYHTVSLWSEANYTAMLTVGLDDPSGSGAKVTCNKIRAVDLSANNRTIGEFSLLPWRADMGGATMMLAVYNNQSSNDPEFRTLQMRNYWTYGDLCSGSTAAKIQLIPPPPPPPQNVPEQIGWSFIYMACFVALAVLVGAAFRGCKKAGGAANSGGGPGFKSLD
mmetsp:Transcript_5884/g.14946  ORF Transcript_5884/g.14946 Transcript_5884/m.14946 type:complete len:387 (-) Transcript_5884:25-1185(-)|eukprot:CAMPEP_0182928326 /NCGR_PEP_ID=MMETSP0105_2-20130417/15528_1 /TAXON_ID=81532 ORGANISM="Acanthoeca-like sp., Strain 10tr" /NCGR_SAMPLE_ID=MMETSP0105_2 /ASSEMBLY_ACC=CAM_ASM_000205 /LENGTH=386 /DNA_ID=CAMNT_0025066327 /DNA_START=81 /DNA_END=1241 /DNA_ORIENTATION=+